MIFFKVLLITILVAHCIESRQIPKIIQSKGQFNERELIDFLEAYNLLAIDSCNANSLANWDYAIDQDNQDKLDRQEAAAAEYASLRKNYWTEFWKEENIEDYDDPLVRRQLINLKQIGTAALNDNDYKELQSTLNSMTRIYNTAKICPYNNQNCQTTDELLSLDPEISEVMATSEDYDELLYVWTEWREKSGKQMKGSYSKYVSMMNLAAVENGVSTATLMWQRTYEEPNFEKIIDDLWLAVEPLYNELHKYVRYKLLELYGDKMDRSNKNIPAHLLGNMWAQNWINLYDRIKPFKDASPLDVTGKMKEQNYDILKMFDVSNEFYQHMGLPSSEMSYSEDAMIEKPIGRNVACHASAHDFCDGKDFRIKMCTSVNMEDFLVVHHEMGHIQYFIHYKDQPLALRGGANPGFHEAIGDTIALSVATPKHLKKINLLDEDYEDKYENDINSLFSMALQRVAFLPFGLLIDKWRWEVFNDDVSENQWNNRWWELREQYQKVYAPVPRSVDDFDPGAKYHVPANSQYISYFVAHILQFQFYKTLCIEADEYVPGSTDKPLYKCDFYDSTAAGKKLSDGLEIGASEPWQDVLFKMTGSRQLDADALLEYFEPLQSYLKVQNDIYDTLEAYNTEASLRFNKLVVAEWNQATDINNEVIENELNEQVAAYAQFLKEEFERSFKDLDYKDYEENSYISRQIKYLKNLGTNILDEDRLLEMTGASNRMQVVYNNVKVCPYLNQNCNSDSEGLNLEEISTIIAESRNFHELEYLWKEWHDNSGGKMREDYKKYVEISNEAAVLNNFADTGDMWRFDYEDDNLVDNVDSLWAQIEPLYDELQTFVRYKLIEIYGPKLMDPNEKLIPAHLFGNMWAQNWVNLYERTKPFKNASDIDVTAQMVAQGYTPLKMFQTSDDFYKNLGLESNEMSYTGDSIIEEPTDRRIICHASAWDFSDGEDFRIKQCTQVTMEHFVTVHHEMGHIQYYILYKGQPIPFRSGANPGFHEAVGDLIALSVSTPKHLEKIGLLQNYEDSHQDNINSLFKMALERLAFMPFGLLIDKYRWDIFSKQVDENNWNAHWEELREKYQKIKSPVTRTEEHFDAGAKFHVASGYQYINYFFAHVLEFQLHKSMCIVADQYDPQDINKPLHKCDIDGSKEVGAKLRAGLSLGLREHWSEALEIMTGETELTAQPLLDYFEPLMVYLREQNRLYEILHDFNEVASVKTNNLVEAEWNQVTDINDKEKEQILTEEIAAYAQFMKEEYEKNFKGLDYRDYAENSYISRQVKYLTNLGTDILDENRLRELTMVGNNMQLAYNNAKVCPFDKQNCNLQTEGLTLDPEISQAMAESENYAELQYIWKEWHDQSGGKMREDYKKYVEISNEAAVLNNFADTGEMWRFDYEDDNLVDKVDALWEKIEPLYNELHTYVRHKLIEIYGSNVMDPNEKLIPAHLLGNMWAQSWVNLYERIKPFRNASDIDVTAQMVAQGYTPLKMFEMSDAFYQDLGLEPNEMSYTGKSIIEKPEDRVIVCHASAWDFHDGEDFRIKQCTTVDMVDFVTVHHEMGHIQYFILYKDQPLPFRTGANPGFHEAVGDLIALSVSTPKHLEKIGLLQNYQDTQEDNINSLFKMALERLAFMPFGLLIDKYRWDIFSNAVKEDQWNAHWEALREKYQKIKSPVTRTEQHFDAGAKYHVASGSQYINYFFAHVLEFQLHRGMCLVAGQYDPLDSNKPLHKCDIDGSLAVGEKLRAGLSLGLSEHWTEALRVMTGETELDAEAVLEYFEPLMVYLKEQNRLYEILHEFNEVASVKMNSLVVAEWDQATDINNVDKTIELTKQIAAYAEFMKGEYEKHFRYLNFNEFKENSYISRQVKFLSNLGTNILSENRLNELTTVGNNMQLAYNNAKVCPFKNQDCNLLTEGLTLDPEISEVMATSEDFAELQYIWTEWYDASGGKMRNDFKKYVEISNEAAVLNNFADTGEMWRFDYEDDDLMENVLTLWSKIEPLYDELHTYVRHRLIDIYGPKLIDPKEKLIPAHLLGNMWAQSWVNLYERIKPFKNASDIDVTAQMVAQGYTPLRMFEISDKFYQDLGLEPNEMSYTGKSIIEKPEDRVIVCHASAWDFSDGEDFRIKQCTTVDMEDFVTVHHEMGHIQYFILYKNQPLPFRDAANPGFHEAVGDLIALSVSTPKHLEKIGLLQNYQDTQEDNINSLFKMALERLAFMPFGLLIDKYRWDIFSNNVPESNWNGYWESLREKYQKIKSPVTRTEEHFDAGGKYHVASGSQYINYFFAHVLEFQLHKGLCLLANQYDPLDANKPLHKCDIDGSQEVGEKLRAGLSLGLSEHWSESLRVMTGETKLEADAILEYFEPLMVYLREQNAAYVAPEVDEDDDNNNDEVEVALVPIIVGSVLGGLLVIGLVGFLIYYVRKKGKQQ